MSYNPSEKTAAMLNFALEAIEALPYEVTTRYAFYRIVQGFPGFKKGDYKKFLQLTAKARKNWWNGWNPETLVDDTRDIENEYGTGFTNPIKWFEAQAQKRPKLEIAEHFDVLPIAMFEAKAMIRQFKYYLDPYRIPLCAFGGDPSIPYKYSIAGFIDMLGEKWPDKEIHVLYFGDYDRKGRQIPRYAIRDIDAWCGTEFEFTRIGINADQIDKYGIPDSPNEPGKYQWEALDDKAAGELITGAIEQFWDKSTVNALKRVENQCGDLWSDKVGDAIDAAIEAIGETELEFPDTDEEELEGDDEDE